MSHSVFDISKLLKWTPNPPKVPILGQFTKSKIIFLFSLRSKVVVTVGMDCLFCFVTQDTYWMGGLKHHVNTYLVFGLSPAGNNCFSSCLDLGGGKFDWFRYLVELYRLFDLDHCYVIVPRTSVVLVVDYFCGLQHLATLIQLTTAYSELDQFCVNPTIIQVLTFFI